MQNIAILQVKKEEFQSLRTSLSLLPPLNANDMAILLAIEDFLEEGEPVYGAFTSNQLVGLIWFGEEKFHKGEQAEVKETLIGILFVHPLFREHGIGSQLVDFVLSHASTPYVLADPVDESAHNFFVHCGFEPNHLYDVDEGGDWLMISKRTEPSLNDQIR